MRKKCKDTEVDIAVLNTRVKSVESFIEDMKKNHLPHIHEKLDDIDIKLAKLNIWDKLKSVSLIAASGMISAMAAYIFLR